ncbi:recombinase family protein [Mucilaginibacter sp.]|uniref:recombinase family protein n=1 Tax=Mucilaginibacter sp. TaxID=1882438 RepID=UPI0032668D78
MKRAIAYYRVSTNRQGKSGLGLEAQQNTVEQYCKMNDYVMVTDVIEVQSTRKHRAGLIDALNLCRQNKATLIVARLDRLGRDVEQIAGIVKSKTEVKVVDNPHANRFTIHILAAVAEEQRQRISETTKEALSAAKKRGVELGKNGKLLSIANRQAADEFAQKMFPTLRQLRKRGIVTVRAITIELNKKGVPAFRPGSKWHSTTVHSLMNRLKNINKLINKTNMENAVKSEILFDDLTVIEALQGVGYLSNGQIVNNNDCTNNTNDCTNNIYTSEYEEFDTAQIA